MARTRGTGARSKASRLVSLGVAVLAAALFGASITILALGGEADSEAALTPAAEENPPEFAGGAPPTPDRLDVIEPKHAKAARQAVAEEKREAPEPEPVETPPELLGTAAEGMPAASAGSNGTYDRSRARAGSLNAETTPIFTRTEAKDRAVLLGQTALAPANAPAEVQMAISAANDISHTPYVWGGGHGSWYSRGYDCSGAVSYALGGAGLLKAPLTSGGLMNWGEPGPGRWITVYANEGHTYAVIAGLRWDTAGEANGSGPRWHAEVPYPEGYTVRHPPGL